MVPKVFITGITGYVGGEGLFALHSAHPDWEYAGLVRSSASGAKVAAVYPKIRLVYGTLSDSAIIEEEAEKADIVLHTAESSDDEPSAKAIAAGLAKHPKSRPGFWIHLSGTAILLWKDVETGTLGEPPSTEPYDDLEGVEALTSLPDDAYHRDIDKIVLAAGSGPSADVVKTVIVCPPTIYGIGHGPVNTRSIQVPQLAQITLELGQAPQIGRGLTEWDNVHVHDLGALFVLLADSASTYTEAREVNSEIWGPKGYMLAENGHHVWGQISKLIGEAAFKAGYIKSPLVLEMNQARAKELGEEALSWGQNSKGFAKRARKFLGWDPKGPSLDECIPQFVDIEAERLGLKTGHGAKAAGGA